MVLPFVDKVFHVGDKKVVGITDKESYLKEQSAPISDVCPEFCGKLPVFSLADVSFSVKERDILKGVTFDIPKGSRTVLLGENSENAVIRSIISSDTKVNTSSGTVTFSLKPHKVFVFDKNTGERLRFTLK